MKWYKSDLCVISSAGGHLSEAIEALSQTTVKKFYVTYGEEHARKRLADEEAYFVEDPHTSILKYMKNFFQSLILMLKKRPRVVFSTGSGIALATCIIGRLLGAKIVFLESGARITAPSKTGKLMYHIADVFIVQWKPLLKYFPNALYAGSLI
jgi:UDP-N-acetylglucosamine:LPS N-acetylglucosamine transferase